MLMPPVPPFPLVLLIRLEIVHTHIPTDQVCTFSGTLEPTGGTGGRGTSVNEGLMTPPAYPPLQSLTPPNHTKPTIP